MKQLYEALRLSSSQRNRGRDNNCHLQAQPLSSLTRPYNKFSSLIGHLDSEQQNNLRPIGWWSHKEERAGVYRDSCEEDTCQRPPSSKCDIRKNCFRQCNFGNLSFNTLVHPDRYSKICAQARQLLPGPLFHWGNLCPQLHALDVVFLVLQQDCILLASIL